MSVAPAVPGMPETINGQRLLDALALVESSGCSTGLRFEPPYMEKGERVACEGMTIVGTGVLFRAEVVEATKEWGPLASCGVSKWQIQASECWRMGYRGAWHLLHFDEVVLPYVKRKLGDIARDLLTHGIQPTVELVAEAWNTGSARDKFTNEDYQKKVRKAYDALARTGV